MDSIDWGVVDTVDCGVGGAVDNICMVGVDGVNGGGGDRTEVDPGVVGAEIGAGDNVGKCFVAAPTLLPVGAG